MTGSEQMVSRNLQTLFLTNRTRLFNERSRDKYSQAFVDQNRIETSIGVPNVGMDM